MLKNVKREPSQESVKLIPYDKSVNSSFKSMRLQSIAYMRILI